MWDYESQEPFQVKLGTFLRKPQKNLEVHKQSPTMNVNCVVETTKLNSVLTKVNSVWEWIPLVLTSKEKLPDGKSKSVDCFQDTKKAAYNLEASPVS